MALECEVTLSCMADSETRTSFWADLNDEP